MTKVRELRKSVNKSISRLSNEISANSSVICYVELRKVVASPGLQKSIAGYFNVPETELFDCNGFAL